MRGGQKNSQLARVGATDKRALTGGSALRKEFSMNKEQQISFEQAVLEAMLAEYSM